MDQHKIIHQIWWQGETNIPDECKSLQASWQRLNPNYTYMLWDETAAIKLLQEHYPAYLYLLRAYKLMIQKVDILKYFILYHYGGFYMDMDMQCLKPLDHLLRLDILKNKRLIVNALASNRVEAILNSGFGCWSLPYLNNACIGSVKHHPIWLHLIKEVASRVKSKYYIRELQVLHTTGPYVFTKVIRQHLDTSVAILDVNYFQKDALRLKLYSYLGFHYEITPAANSYAVDRLPSTWVQRNLLTIITVIIDILLIEITAFIIALVASVLAIITTIINCFVKISNLCILNLRYNYEYFLI